MSERLTADYEQLDPEQRWHRYVTLDRAQEIADERDARIERLEMELQASRAGHRTTQGCYETEQSARLMAERERDEARAELERKSLLYVKGDCYDRICEMLGIESDVISHVRQLRAELEQFKGADSPLRRASRAQAHGRGGTGRPEGGALG